MQSEKNDLPSCLHQIVSLFVQNHQKSLISLYILKLLFDLYSIEVLLQCIVFIFSRDKRVL